MGESPQDALKRLREEYSHKIHRALEGFNETTVREFMKLIHTLPDGARQPQLYLIRLDGTWQRVDPEDAINILKRKGSKMPQVSLTADPNLFALTFDGACSEMRGRLRQIEVDIRALKDHPAMIEKANPKQDVMEMADNITLSYQHVESATMRLGKAIQAFDGGDSVYPR